MQSTRLETDEEVHQALKKYRFPERPKVNLVSREAPADDGPPLFLPTERPPMPGLVVLDDGDSDGELVRIRQERFVLGRTEGDCLIPHDSQLSGRHAELRRTYSKEKHCWHLIDLNSTNGTFVRIGHALLAHGQEFIVGRTCVRFEHPLPVSLELKPSNPATQGSRLWQSSEEVARPTIVVVKTEGNGPSVSVEQSDFGLGKDGRWMIENNKSINGLWLRIERLALSRTCRFLLGEQQFLFRLPS